MQKAYMVSTGWYNKYVFTNITDATKFFEIMSKAQSANDTYTGERYLFVLKDQEVKLEVITTATEEEVELEKQAIKERKDKEEAIKQQEETTLEAA